MDIKWVVICALLGMAIGSFIRANRIEDKLDRLDKVHRIFEDGSVCHLDPDGPSYCAK